MADPHATQPIDEQMADVLRSRDRVFANNPSVGEPPKETGRCADPQRAVRALGKRLHLPERGWTVREIRLDATKTRLPERLLEHEKAG